MKKALKLTCIAVLFVALIASFTSCGGGRKTRALIKAIENDDVQTVRMLLEEKGVDPNKTSVTPSVFWCLLEYAPRRPLSVACREGNLEIVKLLIEHGATAEEVEYTWFAPLRATLFYYHPDDVEIVKILLENGAETVDFEEGDVVFQAAKMTPKVYDKNMTNGTVYAGGYDEETAKGITEIVKILLGERSVDIKDCSQRTLLMFAAQEGNLFLAEYLISEGIDTHCMDDYGKTAYDYAVEAGHNDLIALLK